MKKGIALFICFVLMCFPVDVKAVSESARAAVVINGDNGEIIYQKNAYECLPMASTTKIMTGLLLCEYGNFDRQITVNEQMLKVEGSSMGLLPGDKVTLHDLLYGLMLSSGNDAANVIATVIGGSVEKFVELMNLKAASLGLKNTSFATPSGLDAENHYTTAYELAVLAMHAMKNEEFAKAVSSKKATLCYGNPPYKRTLTNHNKLLNMADGTVGIKTGFTKKSGRCLVSAMKRDGKYIITVTLNDPNDWQDHKNLSNYAFDLIKQIKYSPENPKQKISVIGGEKEFLEVNVNSFFVNSIDTEGIEFELKIPPFLYAPISKEDIVASVVYKKNGEIIGEKQIISGENIKLKNQHKTFKQSMLEKISLILKNF